MAQTVFSPEKIRLYIASIRQSGNSESTIKRKVSSVSKFAQWALEKGKITSEEYKQFESEFAKLRKELNHTSGIVGRPVGKSLLSKAKNIGTIRDMVRPEKYYLLTRKHFVGIFATIALIFAFGIGLYNQFFQRAKVNLAYPATPTRAGRILNFQGFLTDSSATPITTAINMRFRLYDDPSAGTTLYDSGTCSINPDVNGVVNVMVGTNTPSGGSCGAEIDPDTFTRNTNVYLGVTVGADPEMTPRQQVANVGYAINSETLQGLPPGTDKSTIAYINQLGNLLIATSTPGIRSTLSSETFQVSSANALTLISAGSGDITLNATQSGAIKLITNNTTGNQVQATNANLVSGSLLYGYVGNGGTGYNLLQLQSGASPTDRFVVDALGNTNNAGTLTVGGSIIQNFAGTNTTAFTQNVNSLTSGNGHTISSAQGSTSNLFTGVLQNITYSKTYTGTTGIESGNLLNASRNVTMNSLGNTMTLSGSLAALTDNATLSSGALTHSADVLDITQGYTANTGAALNVTTAGTGYALRVNDDGTLTDTTPFVVNAAGNVGIGLTNPQYLLDVSGGAGIVAQFSGRVIGANAVNANEFTTLSQLSASTFWQRNLGVLAPSNITDDLLIGRISTPSASTHDYFQVLGTGTTAGDASSSGALTLGTNRSSGLIHTERMLPLVLGNTTTGSVQLSPKGTSGLFVAGNGNVGIGITNPLSTLSVYNTGGGLARFTSTGDANNLINSTAANNPQILFGVSGTGATPYGIFQAADDLGYRNIALNPSGGNVGIGTTAPTSLLHLNSTTSPQFTISNAANQATFGLDGTGLLGIVPSSGVYLFADPGQASRSILAGSRTMNSASAVYGYNIDLHKTGTGGAAGILAFTYGDASTTGTNALDGGYLYTSITGAYSSGYESGLRAIVTNNASASVTNDLTGIQARLHGAIGTVSGKTAFYYARNTISSGTMPTLYGMYIEPLTQGTANYALFTEGSTPSYFGGNVGIGTSTPTAKLQVAGDLKVDTYASISASLAVGYSSIAPGGGNGAFSGRVGIGTSAPAYLLDVSGGTGIVGQFSGRVIGADAVNTNEFITLNQLNGTTYWQRNLGVLAPKNITDDLLIGRVASPSASNQDYFQVLGTGATAGDASSSGTLTLGTNRSSGLIHTERMLPLVLGNATTGSVQLSPKGTNGVYVDGTGNVGIGTTYTGYQLSVANTIGLTNNTMNMIRSVNANDSGYQGFQIQALWSAFTAGNVGIGITNPDTPLSVYGYNTGSINVTNTIGSNSRVLIGADTNNGGFIEIKNSTGTVTKGTGATVLLNGWTNADSYYNTGGNLGIGTTTSGSRLQVNGSTALGYSAATTGPTNGLTVSGNAGIGITAPTSKLHIYNSDTSNTTTNDLTVEHAGGGGGGQGTGISLNAGGVNFALIQTVNDGAASGSLRFSNRIPGGVTETLRISNVGNVGIGTTNPTAKLHVAGDLKVDSYASVSAGLAVGYSSIAPGGGNGAFSGSVGIGTSTPAYLLDVSGGTGIVGQFSGRVIGGDAVNTNEFITLNQLNNITYWQRNLGVLAPKNITDDLLIGRIASPSASTDDYFQIFGTGANEGDASSSGILTLGTNRSSGIIHTERMLPLVLGNATTGSVQLSPKGTTGLFVDQFGNVGVGTVAPTTKLHSAGTIRISAPSTDRFLDFSNPSSIASATTSYGITGEAYNTGAGTVYGVNITAGSSYVGTVSTVVGTNSGVRTLNAGTTVTTGSAFNAASPIITAGAVTTANGLYIAQQDVTGVGTGYGVFQSYSGDFNYFAGNVGIGTSTPGERLEVSGANPVIKINPTSGSPTIVLANSTASRFQTGIDANLDYYVDSMNGGVSPSLYVNYTSGNVGIGVSNPSAKLQVAGDLKVDSYATVSAGLAVGYSSMMTGGGNGVFSGRVGIGTSNPGFALDVQSGSINSIATGGYYLGGSGSPMNIELTRTISATVGDTVELGNLTLTNGAHNIRITVTAAIGGFSVAKQYLIPIQYHQTANAWQIVNPISSTGLYSPNDFILETNVNANIASFRVRKSAGATSGTIQARIESVGSTSDVWASSSTTSTSAVTAIFSSTPFTQVAGNVGIGTIAPGAVLDVAGNIRSTTGTLQVGNTTNAAYNRFGTAATAHALSSSQDVLIQGNLEVQGTLYGNLNPSFTPGSVIFANATGALAQDNANFYWDYTNTRLGIGTTTVGSKLQVNGSTALGYSASTAGPANGLAVSGNVGIGVTAPGTKLEVNQVSNASETTLRTTVANNAINISGTYTTGNSYPGLTWSTTDNNPTLTKAAIWTRLTASGSYMNFGTSNAYATGVTNTAMTIDYGGNVGIGNTTPPQKLTITGGNIQMTDTGAKLYLTDGNHYLSYDGTNTVALYGTGNYYFNNGSTSTLAIHAGGNVGIGTTAPTTKLTITGGIASENGYNMQTGGSDNLLVNGDFEQGTYGWSGFDTTTNTSTVSGTLAAQRTGQNTVLSDDYIPVDPTHDVFQLEGYFKKTVTGSPTPGVLFFGYIAYDTNKNYIATSPCGTYCYFAASSQTIPADNNWHKYSSTTTGEGVSYPNFPVNTRFVRVLILINYGASVNEVTLVDHVSLKRLNYGPLFVGNNFSSTNMVDQYQVAQLYTTSANNFVISSPGNVGIGVASPGSFLDIGGNFRSTTGTLQIGNASNVAYNRFGTTATAQGLSATNDVLISHDLEVQGTIYGTIVGVPNPGFTPGSVVYIGPSGALAQDNANFFWDGATHRLGIGTTTVGSALQVNGATALGYSASTAGPANGLAVSGNVGIGTTAPATALHISGSTVELRVADASATGNPKISLYQTASERAFLQYDNATITTILDSDGPIGFNTNNTRAMSINTVGNVGVGVVSAAAKLQVAGNLKVDSYATVSAGLAVGTFATSPVGAGNGVFSGRVGVGVSNPVNMLDVSGAAVIGTYAGASAGPANGLAVSGNVGIGTTVGLARLNVGTATFTSADISTNAVLGTAGAYPLTLVNTSSTANGTTNRMTFDFGTSWSSTAFVGAVVENSGTAATGLAFGTYNGSLTEKMRIQNDGNVGIGTTTPTAKLQIAGDLKVDTYATISASLSVGTFNAPAGPGNAVFSGLVGIGTSAPTSKLHIVGNPVGNILTINDGTSDLVTISSAQSTFNNPTSFTSSGDVSIAYDINFTNPTSSFIKSAAPLTVASGETFNSSDLTLKTYNNGDIVMDAGTSGGTGTIAFYDAFVKAAIINTPIEFASGSGEINTFRSTYGSTATLIGAIGSLSSGASGAWIYSGASNYYLYPSDYLNAKVGIGNSNPVNRLTVTGSASIGTSAYNVAAPTSGLIVEGNVGIGTTNPTASYKVDIAGDLALSGGNRIVAAVGTNNNLTLNANGTGIATLNTTGAGTVTIGGTATTVNVATAAVATTVGVGNTTGASSLTLDSGTGAINIGTSIAKTITIGNATGATAVNITAGSGGSTYTTTNSTFALNTGTGAINIGTDAAAKTITMGNTTGATALTFNSGTGAINIGTSIAKTITIGNTTGATSVIIDSGTGAINIGNSIAKTITIGNTTGATAVNINAGSGGSTITTTNSTLALVSGTGAINIGTDAAAKTITIGNVTGATAVNVNTGTAGTTYTTTNGIFTLTTGTGTISLGTDAVAKTINIGNTTGATALTLNGGTAAMTFNDTSTGTNAAYVFNANSMATGTGTNAGFVLNANALTSGGGMYIGSTATAYTGAGPLFQVSKTGTSGSTSLTGDVAQFAYSQSFNSGTPSVAGNVLEISRSITQTAGTVTVAGAVVNITDGASAVTTHSGDVLDVTQNFASNTGAALAVTSYSTNANAFSLRVNDSTGTADTTPFVIMSNGGNVGIGTTSPSEKLDINGDTRLLTGTLQVGNTANAAYNRLGTATPGFSGSGNPMAGISDLFVTGNIGLGSSGKYYGNTSTVNYLVPDSSTLSMLLGGPAGLNFSLNTINPSAVLAVRTDGRSGGVVIGRELTTSSYAGLAGPTNGLIVEGNSGFNTPQPVSPVSINAISAVGQPSGTPSTTGGSMAAGNYYYTVTAVGADGETTGRESAVQNIASGSTGSVVLSWTAVAGAAYYNVYRTQTSGTYSSPSLVSTASCWKIRALGTGQTMTCTDTQTNAQLFAGTPPSNARVVGTAGTATTGGSIGAGTYYYTVTAVVANGETAGVETTGVVIGGANNATNLSWTAYSGAQYYRVYRTTVAGSYGGTNLVGTGTNCLAVTGTNCVDTLATINLSTGSPSSGLPGNANMIAASASGALVTTNDLILAGKDAINGNAQILGYDGYNWSTVEIIGATGSRTNTSLCVSWNGQGGTTCDGKIDAGTIDPPYTINGEKYATYVASMTGVKEETTGTINLTTYVPNVGYSATINFNTSPKGSDAWLFAQTTNLLENMDQMVTLATPSNNARIWYSTDKSAQTLTFYSSRQTTVSYRLTAPRFDYKDWANTRPDSSRATGFILNTPQGLNLTSTGDVMEVGVEIQQSGSTFNLVDAAGNAINEIGSYTQATIARIEAGVVTTQQLIVKQTATFLSDVNVSGTITAKNIQSDNILALADTVQKTSSDTATLANRVNELQSGMSQVLSKDITTGKYYMSVEGITTVNLTVQDTATMSNLIATSAQIGSVSITNNTISTTLSDLRFDALEKVVFFDNAVVIAKDGSITTKGVIVAQGGVKTDSITTTKPGNDLVVTLSNDQSASASGQTGIVDQPKLKIKNTDGSDVASIDASGSAYFADGVTFNKNIASASAVMNADTAWQQYGVSTPAIKTNGESSGQAVIPAGTTELTILNTKVKDNSLLYVTPLSSTNNQTIYVEAKQEGAWFKIKIDQPISTDITFNWWIL